MLTEDLAPLNSCILPYLLKKSTKFEVYPYVFKSIAKLNLNYTAECRKLVKEKLNENTTTTLKILQCKYEVLTQFDDSALKLSGVAMLLSAATFLSNSKSEQTVVAIIFICTLLLAMFIFYHQLAKPKILSSANFVESCVEEIIKDRENM